MATYHAFHYGKMNQSFRMENEQNQVVFDAEMVKFKLFTACDYTFTNKISLVAASHKVGKTISVDQGTAGISMSTASYFKLDGKNCFEILDEKGYSFSIVAKLDILHPEFALSDKSGNRIATYKMNVTSPREENVAAIGNKQSNTMITTESDDIDTVFLGAFILSRVDFSLYLL